MHTGIPLDVPVILDTKFPMANEMTRSVSVLRYCTVFRQKTMLTREKYSISLANQRTQSIKPTISISVKLTMSISYITLLTKYLKTTQ